MKRDLFLARVGAATTSAQLPPSTGAAGPLVWAPAGGELVERFVANLTAVNGIAHRVDAPHAATTVAAVLDECAASRVLAWDATRLPVDGIHAALTDAAVELVDSTVPDDAVGRREHQIGYDTVVAGVTGAIAGLAESGTIVLDTGPGRARMASLIPVLHIALLRSSDIHASLSHFAAAHPDAVAKTSNLVFITGPSRTGDIETHLNLGVHGPRHLHVIIVE